MSEGASIARNAAWLTLATTLNKVLAFAAFAVVARYTGPEITGTYQFALSVTAIFVTLADLGMTSVVIRGIAAGRADGEKLLSAAIRMKLVLAPIAGLCALGYGLFRDANPVALACIGIAIFMMMADAFHLVLYGALRGRRNLRPEALGLLLGQVLTSGGAITAAILGVGPLGIITAYLVGSFWNVLWSGWHIRRLGIRLPAVGLSDFRLLLVEATPFAIAGVAVKLYSYTDSLMLEAYYGAVAVGVYAVPYKMTYAFQFIPLAFVAALYPALSAAWAEKRTEDMRRVFLGSLRLMAAIAFPIMAGLSALAPQLVPFVFGPQFVNSIPVLEVLPWVLLPIFMDFPIGSLLNASNRAAQKTAAMVGTMFINVVLNALLVPSMGPIGAAWAGVFSFCFLLSVGMFFTARDAGGWGALLSILGRGALAGAVSWLAWRFAGTYMPLFAAMCFGGAVSVLAAFALQLMTLEDVKWIRSLRKRAPQPEAETKKHEDV